MMKILWLTLCFSPLAMSAPTQHSANDSGVVNVNIPLSINVIKSTCTINNGAGIPPLVVLGNTSLNTEKKVSMPIDFSHCSNVNSLQFKFSALAGYPFLGGGKFSTSTPGTILTLYQDTDVLSTYQGTTQVTSGHGLLPFYISINSNTAGTYKSAINLSIIYL